MSKGKYEVEQVVSKLHRRGVKFGVNTADASRMSVVGIDTLGKLDFLTKKGYKVTLRRAL